MRLAATRCPVASISSTSVRPDLSEASSRVSETVRTAMLTGRKGRVSLILGDMATARLVLIESGIGRPLTRSKRIEIRRRLPQAHAINPVIGQHAFGVDARLRHRRHFEEEQRIA